MLASQNLFNDTMYLFYLYFRRTNIEEKVASTGTCIFLCVISQFWSLFLLIKVLKLGNNFGAKPYLIRSLECTGYYFFNFIQEFYSYLELSFAIQLKKTLGIDLKFPFICVLLLVKYLIFLFAFWWTWNFNSSSSFLKNYRSR